MANINAVIALIERGGTEGEKSAAKAAYKRITGKDWLDPKPEVIFNTEVKVNKMRVKEPDEYEIIYDYNARSYRKKPKQSYNDASTANQWSTFAEALSKAQETKFDTLGRVKEVLRANRLEYLYSDINGIQYYSPPNASLFVKVSPNGNWEIFTKDYSYAYSSHNPGELSWHIKRARGEIK